MSGRVLARPIGLEVAKRTELWLPEQSAVGRKGFEICDPTFAQSHKMVAYKFRLSERHRWYGHLVHSKLGEDIDEKGGDGLSFRDQIHRLMVGIIERATRSEQNPDGIFVHHDSDEMQGKTWIEQWPELEHCVARWDRFYWLVPPKRDSPQLIENV